MATQIGVIKALIGTATATAADGSIRTLQVGDNVYENELITTGQAGAIEIEFADGSLMDLGRSSQALLDNEVFDPTAAAIAATDVEADVDAIQQALLEGADPTQITEATAAGAGVEGGNEGHEAVFVDYEEPEVTPEAGFETVGVTNEFDEREEEQFINDLTTTITLNDVIVNEGEGTATITATLDTAVTGSPLVITLSNGATITIPVGATTGESTPFEIQGDDPYVDGESFEVSITGTAGGNFASVDTTDTATVTINDTIDTTVITLGDVTVNEGSEGATITATVDSPVTESPLVITLDNGATITIPVGETTAESTPFEIQGDDVYVDGENFEVSMTGTTGGNYEDLDTSDTATVTVNDTEDTVTATLTTSTSEISEDGDSIVYTVTLSGGPGDIDPDTALVFTLANGETVTINAGETSGSVIRDYTGAQITDQTSIDNSISEITLGGTEYENLITAGTTSVTVDYKPEISNLTPAASGGDVTVDEDDLADGTDTDKESTIQEGTFTIEAEDGVGDLTIGGHTVISNGSLVQNPSFTTDFGNTLTVTGYNDQTGEVTYEYTLNNNTLTHDPADGENSVFENFAVVLTDTDGDETTDTLSVQIVDDVPEANNDVDSNNVRSAEGNVITGEGTDDGTDGTGVDVPGADGAQVSGVTHGETTGTTNDDGSFTVQGDHGALTIKPDGSYEYQYMPEAGELEAITTTAYNLGESFLDSDGEFSAEGATGAVTMQANGLGVAGTSGQNEAVPNQINYSGSESEALAFRFGLQTVTSATVAISNMFQSENGGEAARWHAFDADGNQVASGIISANDDGVYANTTEVTWANNHQGTFTISDIGAFSTLVFEALPYSGDGNADNDNSDYFVQVTGYEVAPATTGEYTDEFTYTLTDGDGDTDTATLTINGNAITGEAEATLAPVAVDNVETVNENATVEGNVITDDNDVGGAASGRDWDADTPLSNLSIATVNGESVAINSDATVITTNYGTLTINSDGSYSYVANGSAVEALADGESVEDSFIYTLIDPNSNVSEPATLTITVTGANDGPVATNNTNSITEDSVDVTGNMLTDDDGFGTDSDVDSDILTVSNVDTAGANQYGTLSFNADGGYTYTLDNGNAAVQALGDDESLTETYTYTVSDGDLTDTATLVITINGTNDGPVAIAVSGNGLEDSDGITVTLSATDVDGTVESFVIQSLPENGTLFIGDTQITTSGTVISATDGGATLTFMPDADWSDNNGDGPVTFEYVAVDNDGEVSDTATATVNVTPVTDTPTVELTLTQVTDSELLAADLFNVLSNPDGMDGNPAGFTVTAFNQFGEQTDIAIRYQDENGVELVPTGFGVTDDVETGGGAAAEIEQGELLVVELDAPASSVTFQLAWLRGGTESQEETGQYTIKYTDGSSETFTISGNDPLALNDDGVADRISQPITVNADSGKMIATVEFGVPEDGKSDFLLHSISYEAATTSYSVDITATPTDTDFSESITHLSVTTPEGVELSDSQFLGTEDGVSTWELLLTGDDDYTGPTVQVDPETGVVTVSGLTLTVPSDYEGELTVTATATAYDPDAASTAEGSDSETVTISSEPDNDVSITVSGDAVIVDEDDLPEGSDTDKESTTQQGTFTISAPDGVASLTVAGTVVISNGVFSAENITTDLGNMLSITGYDADTGVVTYTYTLNDNEEHATAQGENSLSEEFAVRLEDTDGDVATDTLTVQIVDDVPEAVNDAAEVKFNQDVSGNLLTNDVSGADTDASMTSISFGDDMYTFENGEVTIDTPNGLLTVNGNGDYTYESQISTSVSLDASNDATNSVEEWIAAGDIGLYGFGDQTWISEGKLQTGSLDTNAANRVEMKISNNASKAGVGVKAIGGNTSIGSGEYLVIDLGSPTIHVSMGIGQFNAGQEGAAAWQAFDADGNLVTDGTFGSAVSNGNIYEIDQYFDGLVQYIAFSWDNNSDGYVVSKLEYDRNPDAYEEEFSYTMQDGDGDTSSATLTVSASGDVYEGTEGDDYLTGSEGDDWLLGGAGNDILEGLAGDDVLTGGAGDDILIGGAGDDILSGGTGADEFVWNDGDTGTDQVTDFSADEGDVLNLADLLDPTGALDIGGTDSLDNYLTANFDSDTNTTTIDIYTGGDANSSGTVAQTIVVNGDVSDLNTLLTNNNLNVDQS